MPRVDQLRTQSPGTIGALRFALDIPASVLDYIPPDLHQSIIDSTNSVDLAPYIQQALDENHAVYAPPGEYMASKIRLNPLNSLCGAGHGLTTFKQCPGAPADLISLKINTAERISIRQLSIDGNKANQQAPNKGVSLSNTGAASAHIAASLIGSNDPRHFIQNVLIYNTKGDGLSIDGRGESMIDCVWILGCDGHGIYNNAFDNWFSNISIGAAGLHGLFNDAMAYDCRFSNIKSWFSGMVDAIACGDGIHHRGYYCAFSSVQVQDSKRHGVSFYQAGYNVFSGTVQSPGSQSNPSDGFRLFDSRNNTITAAIRDRDAIPSMQYGIRLESGGSGVAGNSIAITVGGAQMGNHLFENPGFSGQSLLVVNGQTVGDLTLSGGTWDGGCLRMGSYRLWIDAGGALRIKNGQPTADLDGQIVGAQA